MNIKLLRFKVWRNKVVILECPVVLLASLVVLLGLGTSTLNAQTFFGSVVGTVTDSSGAIVPGATVTITDIGTAEKHTAQTNSAGEYRFIDLVPSNYSVSVDARSFKRFVQESVMVQVDSTLRVDSILQVGAATETVEVDTAPPLLQTESGSVGSVVEGQTVQEMPLNGRNVMNLVTLTPGVTGAGGAAPLNGQNHTSLTGFDAYSIGGAVTGEGADYLDGAPDNVLGQNTEALIPTQDAVQEFKVNTNAISAEYGRFGGGVIAMTTKSGTNAFHGSAYEYLRNTVLDANNFFNKVTTPVTPVSKYNQNQYGVVATGPIKKDKIFGMFSWEEYHVRQALTGGNGNTNVPGDGTHGTTDMRHGVFPDTTVSGGKYVPRTLNDPGGVCKAKDPAGVGIVHNAIAGTYTIPAACEDPTSQILFGFYPGPNNAATAAYNFNYLTAPVIGDNTTQYNGRGDYDISSKQRVFARYSYWKLNDIGENLFYNAPTPPALNSVYASTKNHSQQVVLGDTYTVNSTTIADLRLAYTKETLTNLGATYNSTNEANFGPYYAQMAPQLTFKSQPNLSFSGNDGMALIIPQAAVQQDKYDVYSINASLSKFVGNHTLKFGWEGRLSQMNSLANYAYFAGYASYNNSSAGVGDEIASFYMGEFATNEISTMVPPTVFNYSYAFYGTDTWKVTRKLTVNLGLRWELPGGMEEKKDRTTVLLPYQVDPVTGLEGTIALVNSPFWGSRSMEPIQYRLFSPRLGFAQTLGKSTVVRGGFGIIYPSPDLAGGVLPAYVSPVSANLTTTTNLPSNPTYFEQDPFPTSLTNPIPLVLQPSGRNNPNFTKALIGQIITGAVPSTNYPYITQYNLSLSHQWKGGWLTEVAGVGAQGTHIPINANNGTPPSSIFSYNQIPDGSWNTNGTAATGPDTGSPLTANSVSTNAACLAYAAIKGQAHPTVGQCLKPYPQYQDVQDWEHNTASSDYHGLYATLLKHFGASGGVLNANYVWAKSLDDDATPQDWYSKASARGGVGSHRVNISYVLDLPFGKGKPFFNSGGALTNAVIGGWAVNGITTMADGGALAFSTNGGNNLSSNFGAGGIRANVTPGCQLKASGSVWTRWQTQNYFNASCVSGVPNANGAIGYGNAPRSQGNLRSQGTDNYDFSAVKGTKIRERIDAQFRVEFFNFFNHMQFGAPGTSVAPAQAGGAAGRNYNTITSQANSPRIVQGSLRVNF